MFRGDQGSYIINGHNKRLRSTFFSLKKIHMLVITMNESYGLYPLHPRKRYFREKNKKYSYQEFS